MENTLSELNKGVNEPSENNIAAIEPEHSEDLGEKRIPAWPLATRGCPDPILRSELFGVVAKGKRVHFRNHVIKSWKGTKDRKFKRTSQFIFGDHARSRSHFYLRIHEKDFTSSFAGLHWQ